MTIATKVRAVVLRLRADYGGRNRLGEYETLLGQAQEAGYRLLALGEFRAAAASDDGGPILGLRHDVDVTDVAGNRGFHAIETALGARATYYFRRSTIVPHRGLVAELLADGFEVGYHYEEAARVAMRRRIRTREALLAATPEIQADFLANAAEFRRRWNPDLASGAAHGDWLNRRLGVRNTEFVTPELLAQAGLTFEAYDESLIGAADVYLSDVAAPPARWANGYGLDQAIRDGRRRIYLLAHERQWHTSRRSSLRADVGRVTEAIAYRF